MTLVRDLMKLLYFLALISCSIRRLSPLDPEIGQPPSFHGKQWGAISLVKHLIICKYFQYCGGYKKKKARPGSKSLPSLWAVQSQTDEPFKPLSTLVIELQHLCTPHQGTMARFGFKVCGWMVRWLGWLVWHGMAS